MEDESVNHASPQANAGDAPAPKATPVQLMWIAPLAACFLGVFGLVLIAYTPNRDASELPRRERLIIVAGAAIGLLGSVALKPFVCAGIMS